MTPPHSHAVHALLNFPVAQYKKVWFPDNQKEGESHLLTDKLVDILKDMVFFIVKDDPDDNYSGNSNGLDMDETVAPLVLLLKKLAEDDDDAKAMLKSKLLPDNMYVCDLSNGCMTRRITCRLVCLLCYFIVTVLSHSKKGKALRHGLFVL